MHGPINIRWLIIFREEHRLRMFENRVLRKISGAKREFWETEENCIFSSFLTQYYWRDHGDGAHEIFDRKKHYFEDSTSLVDRFCHFMCR